MRNMRFGLISGFKFQSILAKTLAVLLVLIALTVGSVFLLFRGLVAERYREASQHAQQLLLSRIGASVDQAIEREHHSMGRLFADQNVTGLMISPARYDYARLASVMDALFQLADQDILIRRASLYVFGNDMVYASDGEIGTILESADKQPLIACLTATGSINVFQLDGREVGLLEWDGRMLLFQTYPSARANGLLMVELDTGRFYQETVELRGGLGDLVVVQDQNGRALFGGEVDADSLPDLSGAAFGIREQDGYTVYAMRSERTGLVVSTRVSTSDVMPTFRTTLVVAMPYLAVMVVVIVLLAVCLIWTTYKPVQDVVYSMAAAGGAQRGEGCKNELDFIHSTYRDSEQKNTMLSEMLAEVAPAVTEKVFQLLLCETPPDEREVRELLASIDSPFVMDARYTVLFLQMRRNEAAGAPSLDTEIGGVWMLRLCRSYWQDRAKSHFLPFSDNACVGVLCFESTVPKSKISFRISDFEALVQKQSRDMRFSWDMGVGRLHIGILEVRASYLEAREALNRSLYYRREAQSDSAVAGGAAHDSAYFTGRMRQLAGFAVEGRMDDALAGLSLLQEMEQQYNEDPSKTGRIERDIRNVLIEEMVRCHIDPDSMPPTHPEPNSLSPGREAVLRTFCETALSQLLAAGQRGRNKHVDIALKYIADNYTSTSLSLDEVSAHVGITSSYLSRIFSESVGSGFLDHLNQYRIDKARQLLTATDLQISEVGYQVGFSSSQSFTRVFKKQMGTPPSAYRESMRRLANHPGKE